MPAGYPHDSSSFRYVEETLVSGIKASSSNSGDLGNYGPAKTIRAGLVVATGASGTNPTLDVIIQDTLDGVNYNTIATFTQVTGTGAAASVQNVTTPFADRIRVKWTLGGTGTPAYDFKVIVATEAEPL